MSSRPPSVIATLATIDAIQDLRVLLLTLSVFNPNPPTVYLYCDHPVSLIIPRINYPGKIFVRKELDLYSGFPRSVLESLPGKNLPTRWADFMAEKIYLMNWAFTDAGAAAGGVLFCDADICFLGPLPSIPERALAALSPHAIRPRDEAKFGKYNGGFVWLSGPAMTRIWLEACPTAFYFEQSALEDVAEAAAAAGPGKLYEFPVTQNYGWWRLWQGEKSVSDLQKLWTMNRMKSPEHVGILVDGEPLGSVHTHFYEKRDGATMSYNEWVLKWVEKLAPRHPPAKRLLDILRQRSL